ncbi:hypothetical protein BaRGS_00034945 [Batillaria attramentaria]|uniref:SURF1-like protein n=1 Tax=Batillaria attramentaria TaxID=370345 RepID=A0ABD0JG49_9CAEN
MRSFGKSAAFLRLLVPRHLWRNCVREEQTQAPRLTKALRKKQTFGESGYILLIVPFATFCLGTWQVKRRRWKLDLIADLEERTQSPPVELPLDLSEVSKLEYRPVILRGEFDHSREMYISPRSNVLKEGGGLVSAGNQTGTNVVTPFKLSGRDETILVNRGWVPNKLADATLRQEGQVKGEVQIKGIVRTQEQRAPFMPKTMTDTKHLGYWLYRDVEAMAEYAGTAPVFVDQDLKSSFSGGPVGGQTRVTLRNEHMSYIITWYSLSAITFAMWYRRYRRPPPPNSAFDYVRKTSK